MDTKNTTKGTADPKDQAQKNIGNAAPASATAGPTPSAEPNAPSHDGVEKPLTVDENGPVNDPNISGPKDTNSTTGNTITGASQAQLTERAAEQGKSQAANVGNNVTSVPSDNGSSRSLEEVTGDLNAMSGSEKLREYVKRLPIDAPNEHVAFGYGDIRITIGDLREVAGVESEGT